MTFTIVDGAVALVLLLSAVLAFSRGFTRELLSVGGWVIAAAAAFALAPSFEPMVKDIPVIGEFVAPSCELTMLTAFAGVFGVALIVLTVLTSALASAVRDSALGPIDRGLGFFFGVARGVILLVIAYMLYDLFGPDGAGIEMVEKSASIGVIADAAQMLAEQTPDRMPDWLADWIHGLMGECAERQPAASA